MACDCLKGLIRIFRDAIAPKPPQPVKEYKQYAKGLMNYWKIIEH